MSRRGLTSWPTSIRYRWGRANRNAPLLLGARWGEAWLPRRRVLQPVFTKQYVTQFAGHMAEAADKLSQARGHLDLVRYLESRNGFVNELDKKIKIRACKCPS